MAKVNNTPVGYWLGLTLRDLHGWIKASNILVDEEQHR
jgi:hypothetical protein